MLHRIDYLFESIPGLSEDQVRLAIPSGARLTEIGRELSPEDPRAEVPWRQVWLGRDALGMSQTDIGPGALDGFESSVRAGDMVREVRQVAGLEATTYVARHAAASSGVTDNGRFRVAVAFSDSLVTMSAHGEDLPSPEALLDQLVALTEWGISPTSPPLFDETSLHAAMDLTSAYFTALRRGAEGSFTEANEKAYVPQKARGLWRQDGRWFLDPGSPVPEDLQNWLAEQPQERLLIETTMMDGSVRFFRALLVGAGTAVLLPPQP